MSCSWFLLWKGQAEVEVRLHFRRSDLINGKTFPMSDVCVYWNLHERRKKQLNLSEKLGHWMMWREGGLQAAIAYGLVLSENARIPRDIPLHYMQHSAGDILGALIQPKKTTTAAAFCDPTLLWTVERTFPGSSINTRHLDKVIQVSGETTSRHSPISSKETLEPSVWKDVRQLRGHNCPSLLVSGTVIAYQEPHHLNHWDTKGGASL